MSDNKDNDSIRRDTIKSFVRKHMLIKKGSWCNSEDLLLALAMYSTLPGSSSSASESAVKDMFQAGPTRVLNDIIDMADEYYAESTGPRESTSTSVFSCVEKSDKSVIVVNISIASFPDGAMPDDA